MADRLTKEQRSLNMALIRAKDTKPEMKVRRFLHRNGFRYSLHRKNLPGKPDIVLRKWKTVIFVNGCYWHRHQDCKMATIPKTNTQFWMRKFKSNVERDQSNYQALINNGWNVIIVWECEIEDGSFKNDLVNNITKKNKA